MSISKADDAAAGAEPDRPGRRIMRGDAADASPRAEALKTMVKFLLWCILLVLCWPLALLALILYPVVWLLLLPFRLVGIAVGGVLELVSAVILLPVRVLRAI
jgi:hypothetical protein